MDGPVFLAPIHAFERVVVHPDELEVMDTAWSLCVFKADPGIRLGLSFHAAAERPTLSRVDSKGAAASSGLEPGDVILEIDGQPVTAAHVRGYSPIAQFVACNRRNFQPASDVTYSLLL